MTYAIEPKSRADEDKLAPAIHKLMEEDLLIRFYRDPQTNEFLIAGAGQPHIEAIVSRLKKRYHAEVTLKAPKVPYLETIRAKAEAHGRHKKQSGGHGQFGDCKIRMEPQPRGAGFEFANEVFGGKSRAISSRPSKRASSRRPRAATSPAIPSSTSRSRFLTAPTTTSIPTSFLSKPLAAWPSKMPWSSASHACSSPS